MLEGALLGLIGAWLAGGLIDRLNRRAALRFYRQRRLDRERRDNPRTSLMLWEP
jgi:hypothetical protein